MNRIFLLGALLVMFLSCGNASLEPGNNHFTEYKGPKIFSNLSAEQHKLAAKLDVFFTGLHNSGAFNGSVLVSKAGRVIYRKSLGYLDRPAKNMLTDSSMFQLASVSKVITATAILMLHERKQLDISKPFTDYFPDFPYPGVTVKELLSHRSGLPNYIYCLNSEICKPNYKMSNLEMYNTLLSKKVKPYLQPGKRFNYCNTNYALLALLIEKVAGTSYSSFLRQEIFVPLGMKNTATIEEIDLNGDNITRPYDNRWRPIGFDASDYVLGDKSLYSTPYDLFLFSEALYQDRIISSETQELAYTAFSKEKKLSNYGYGWRMRNFNDPDKKEVYHNGWWHGYRSAFNRRLKDTLTVVILSNQLNSTAYQTNKVYQILDSSDTPALMEEDEQ